MELRLLQYFLAVAREENITRAAETLHVTQPTLSRQVAQLEEELGVRLFERSVGPGKLTLTKQGVLFCRRARELLELADKARQELTGNQQELSGTVSIGCGEIASVGLLPGLFGKFRALHPLVRFEVFTATTDLIVEKMEQGLLDLGLLLDVPSSQRYDYMLTGFHERWAVLVPAGDPLGEKESVTPQDLKDRPLILPGGMGRGSQLTGWFGTDAENLKAAVTCNLTANAAVMAMGGLGCAPVIEGTVPFDPVYVVSRPLSPELSASSVLIWKKDQILSDAALRFLEYARETFSV